MRLLLLRALDVFARAIELAHGGAEAFYFALFGIFLDLGLFEDFERLLHFQKERFEVSVDPLHLFYRLPDGRSGISAPGASLNLGGGWLRSRGRFNFSRLNIRMLPGFMRFPRLCPFDCLRLLRSLRFSLCLLNFCRSGGSR